MLDTTDPLVCNKYRLVYGIAARLLEVSRFDRSYGRDFARRIEPERIREEVASQCPTIAVELVDLAVNDALAGRRPRW
jgi:hypothetical protein